MALVALVALVVLFQDQLASIFGDELALALSAMAPAAFGLGASVALGRSALLSLTWTLPLAGIAGIGVVLLPWPWGLLPLWGSVVLTWLMLFSDAAVQKWHEIIALIVR